MAETPEITVRDNPDAGRFEAAVGEALAVAEYRLSSGILIFTHTEVPKSLEGQGVGGALVRGALEQAREKGHQVAPMCPFVAGWIRRHREYEDLVHPRFRYMVK